MSQERLLPTMRLGEGKVCGRIPTTQTGSKLDEELEKHRCGVRQLLKYRQEWGIEGFRAWINDGKVRFYG